MTATVQVRKAIKEDMVHVFELIKELAQFEQLEEQVKITPQILEADGFAQHPSFQCVIAEIADTGIIGYALFYYCYSTWRGKSIFLEDLYVKPAYRRLGAGKQLFLHVARLAHELCNRLDFHVLSWNPADNFYKSLGACDLTQLEQWHLFRMDENSLNALFEQ